MKRRALNRRYGRAKTAARQVSPEETAQATEFYRRQNNPRVEVRRIAGNRDYTVILTHHQLGEIGSKTEILKRGKVVSVHYVLPALAGLRAKKWWPEPDALFPGGS